MFKTHNTYNPTLQFRECNKAISVQDYYETLQNIPTNTTDHHDYLIHNLSQTSLDHNYAIIVPLKGLLNNESVKNILSLEGIRSSIITFIPQTTVKSQTLSSDQFFGEYKQRHTQHLTLDDINAPKNKHIIMTKNDFIKIMRNLIRQISSSKQPEINTSKSKLIASFGAQNNMYLSTSTQKDPVYRSYDFTSEKCIVELNFLQKLKTKLSEKFISTIEAKEISQSIDAWRQEPNGSNDGKIGNVVPESFELDSKKLFQKRSIESTNLEDYLSKLFSFSTIKTSLSLDDNELSFEVSNGKKKITIQNNLDKTIDQTRYKALLSQFGFEETDNKQVNLN